MKFVAYVEKLVETRGSPAGQTELTTGAVTVTVAEAGLSVLPTELVALTQKVVVPTAPEDGI